MGIASGIFWIVFGLLYILYRAFKENPSDTITGILLFCIVLFGILAWHAIFNALLKWNIVVAAIFGFGVLGAVLWYGIKTRIETDRKLKADMERCRRALEIARTEPIDEEELKKFTDEEWAHGRAGEVYNTDKVHYRMAADKSIFREKIVKDYIEKRKYYEVIARLREEEEKQKK